MSGTGAQHAPRRAAGGPGPVRADGGAAVASAERAR